MIELPLVAEELAELLGLDLAMRIVDVYGGTSIYVPATMTEGHTIEQLIGLAAATALAERYGGDVLRVPRCFALLLQRRNDQIRAEHVAGRSARELALAYRMTERHIWRILESSPEPDPRQGNLL